MTDPAVKPIPEGMNTLIPHLVCANATEAIDFYRRAFGAVEMSRMPGPDGKLMNAMLRIGDTPLMLVDEAPQWKMLGPKALGGTPVTIHRYVVDTDAAIAQAVAAGATVAMPAGDMFWGDRYGVVEDPYGHKWSIATHLRDLTPQQIQQAFANAGM